MSFFHWLTAKRISVLSKQDLGDWVSSTGVAREPIETRVMRRGRAGCDRRDEDLCPSTTGLHPGNEHRAIAKSLRRDPTLPKVECEGPIEKCACRLLAKHVHHEAWGLTEASWQKPLRHLQVLQSFPQARSTTPPKQLSGSNQSINRSLSAIQHRLASKSQHIVHWRVKDPMLKLGYVGANAAASGDLPKLYMG